MCSRPDLNAIRALTSAQPGAVKSAPAAAVSRVAAEERELPRQGSLVDGEGIKIVIHDVDSDLGKSYYGNISCKMIHMYVLNPISGVTTFFSSVICCPLIFFYILRYGKRSYVPYRKTIFFHAHMQ